MQELLSWISAGQYSSLAMHELYAKEGTEKEGSCSISCSPGYENVITVAHSTLMEFENGGFTLKTREMFSVHVTSEEFENETIIVHF